MLIGTGSPEPHAKSMTPACVGILPGVEAKSDEDVEKLQTLLDSRARAAHILQRRRST
jgi:hypothetical protein